MKVLRGIILLHLLISITGYEDNSEHICDAVFVQGPSCDCYDAELSCTVDEHVIPDRWKEYSYDSDTTKFDLQFHHDVEEGADVFPYYVFSKFPSLKELEISGGSFPVLKKYVFHNISTLDFIRISDSRIQKLDKLSFANLQSLKTLEIVENNIAKIQSEVFKNLPVLDYLTLDNNQIEDIDNYAFRGISSLRELHLTQNKLKALSTNVFSGLTELTTLNLDKNKILQLNNAVFADLNTLNLLSLNYNQITRISPKAFVGLNSLTTLSMNHNNISSLRGVQFQYLKAIMSIDFADNKLKTVKQSWVKALNVEKANGPSIIFVENPLDCSCDLKWLLNIKDNFLFRTDIDDMECTISKQFPYPGKSAGESYRLKDIRRNGHDALEKLDLCDKSLPTKPGKEEELNSTPSVDEGSSVDGERKTDKHYVDSTEDKNKRANDVNRVSSAIAIVLMFLSFLSYF